MAMTLQMTSITSPHKMQGKFLLVAGTALRPVYTGDRYRLLVYTGRRAEKHCMTSFFCTGRIYGRPVHTTRIYWCKKCARIYCPYIRYVFTARHIAKRSIYRHCVSVCLCVCHTPVLHQNG